MKKYDKFIQKRFFYGFPAGKWTTFKDDRNPVLEVGKLPGTLPHGWNIAINSVAFGVEQLREFHGFQLSVGGMKKCLERFGPLELREPWPSQLFQGETYKAPHFVEWWEDAILIQRAYSLLAAARYGKPLKWDYDAEAEMFKVKWIPKLRTPQDSFHSMLPWDDLHKLTQVEFQGKQGKSKRPWFEDNHVSREMTKMLLARLIDYGLKSRRNTPVIGMSYNLDRCSFSGDVLEHEVMPLRLACWLILRDMTTGVTHNRFCHAPGCRKNISKLRRDARYCNNSCTQSHRRSLRRANAK